MENKSASLFITKLRERKDKNGNTYFIGSIGMATMMLRKHKTNENEWNMFLMEPLKKDNAGAPQGSYQQSGGGYAGPFENNNENDEIPF